jgi:methylated-DNA-[protein]-cysteine S-methyltransferase
MIDLPCPEWEQRMVAALAGDLYQREKDALEDHVQGCEECRVAWQNYQDAGAALEVCCAAPALPRIALPAVLDSAAWPAAVARRRGPAWRSRPQPVAVATLQSPIGPLQVAVCERGLCRIDFGADRDAFVAGLRQGGYGEIVDDPRRTAEVVAQLSAYFAGQRKDFDLPVDLSSRSPFDEAVLRTTATVAAGAVATYAGVAALIGRPRASRAVGNALRRNPVPIVIPCHRVIGTDGALHGYAGGLETKRALLAMEGAAVAG